MVFTRGISVAIMLMMFMVTVSASASQPNDVNGLKATLAQQIKELGDKDPKILSTMNTLATAYLALGKAGEALPLYERVLEVRLASLGEKNNDTLTSMNNLASLYLTLGRMQDALPLLEKCAKLRKELLGENHPDTLTSLNNAAAAWLAMGQVDKAVPICEQIYSTRAKAQGERHPDTLASLDTLGSVYYQAGKINEATSCFERALNLRKEVLGEENADTLVSMHNLSAAYEMGGRSGEALVWAARCLQLRIKVLGDIHPDTLSSWMSYAAISSSVGRVDESRRALERLVQGVEKLRSGGNLSAENRQALFSKWVPAYRALAALDVRTYRESDAFVLSELTKARTLLELSAGKIADRGGILSEEEAAAIQKYERDIADWNVKAAKANGNPEEKFRMEAEKNKLLNELTQYRSQLMIKYPKYARLNAIDVVEPEKAPQIVPENAIFISYLVQPSGEVIAFTITREAGLKAQSLGKVPHLEQTVLAYRNMLTNVANTRIWQMANGSFVSQPLKPAADAKLIKDWTLLSRYLGEKIVEPLQSQMTGKKRVIISPDGCLAAVPFETLIVEGKPFVTNFDVSYIQSLSMYEIVKKRAADYQKLTDRRDLLLMGNPVYQDPSDPYSETRGKISNTSDVFRISWPNLPGAGEEIERLRKEFADRKPDVFQQLDASEAKLKELNAKGELSKYKYMIFSVHGYLSSETPELSAIVLSQINNPPDHDGYVTASEWPAFDIRSDLIVLSACETGLGKIVQGEGVMGLPYAFYVAGNTNTVLTLWKVIDKSTAQFMIQFFEKIKQGQSHSEALNATKREFLAHPLYNKPIYWAPFIMYGS